MKKLIGAFFLNAFSFILSWLIFFQLVPEDIYPAVSSSLIGGKESFRMISSDPDTRLQLVWAYEAKVPQSQRKKIENYQRIQDLSFKRLKTDETWDLSDEGYLQSGIKGAEFSFVYPKYSDNVYVFCLKTSGGDAIIRHDYPGGHSFYRIEGENTDALPLSSAAESSHAWMIPQWAFTLLSGLTLSGLLIYIFLKYLRTHPLTEPEKLITKTDFTSFHLYLTSFFLPVLLALTACCIIGFAPFGEHTFLYNDMTNQNYKFIMYLKNMPNEGNDYFYTFSKNLGGNMMNLFSFYLGFPLFFLVHLFPDSQIPSFCTFLIILHSGLAGFSSCLYLRQNNRSKTAALLFSCSYALMSFNIVCAENIHFTGNMVLLPIIILGLEQEIRLQKPLIYTTFLALSLVFNFYFGYMICIFSFIWFLFIEISENRKSFVIDLLNFLFHSIIAVGLAMVVILPFMVSLGEGPKTFSLSKLFPKFILAFPELVSKFCTGSFDHTQVEGGPPSLFFGTFSLVFLLSCFFIKEIPVRKRLAAFGIGGIFLLSFSVSTFYLIWHGFNYPYWWPSRFAFVTGFFHICLAAEAFDYRSKISWSGISFVFTIITVIFLLSIGGGFSYISMPFVVFDWILVVICLLFTSPTFQEKKQFKRLFPALAFLLLLPDLLLNMAYIWKNNFDSVSQTTAVTSTQYYQDYENVYLPIKQIKSTDPGFYRFEFALHKGENQGFLYSTNSVSHFSSTNRTDVMEFLDRMGFSSRYNSTSDYRYGSTITADSILGIKYVGSANSLDMKPYPIIETTPSMIFQINTHALSLGMLSSSKILTTKLIENDIFSNQEKILSDVLDQQISMFTQVPFIDLETSNLGPIQQDQYTVWRKTVPDKPGILTWHIQIDRPDMLYAYFPVLSQRTAYISLNDKLIGKTIDPDNYGVIPLGTFQPGEEISVSLQFDAESISFFDTFFMYEDQAELAARFDEKITPLTNIKKLSSSHLSGEISAEEPGQWLLLTIPYSDEWQVTLNGRPVTAEKVLDALMAVPLEQGHNFLELKFVPKGFEFGAILSCLSLFIFALSELKRHGVSTKRPW